MSRPLVTIVMCVYNAGEYLEASVASALGQTHREIELLLVDDGSTDGAVDALLSKVSDARMRVIRQENQGKPAALNRAIAELKGEYYAVQDADDLSFAQRIERQLAEFEADPELAAVFCGHELILDDKRVAPRFRHKNRADCVEEIAAFRMPAHDPTGMYRMSKVRDILYGADFPICQGHDYILRVGEAHPIEVLGECLYTYRVHRTSITKRTPQRREKLKRLVLQKACDRRGADFDTEFPHLRDRGDGEMDRPEILDNNLPAHFIESVLDHRRAGRWPGAMLVGWQCAKLQPLSGPYYKPLIYATAPRSMVNKVRRSHGLVGLDTHASNGSNGHVRAAEGGAAG
ncbi:MAG: glycosyltransferase family A protein [Planctomycetota bacterium]